MENNQRYAVTYTSRKNIREISEWTKRVTWLNNLRDWFTVISSELFRTYKELRNNIYYDFQHMKLGTLISGKRKIRTSKIKNLRHF